MHSHSRIHSSTAFPGQEHDRESTAGWLGSRRAGHLILGTREADASFDPASHETVTTLASLDRPRTHPPCPSSAPAMLPDHRTRAVQLVPSHVPLLVSRPATHGCCLSSPPPCTAPSPATHGPRPPSTAPDAASTVLPDPGHKDAPGVAAHRLSPRPSFSYSTPSRDDTRCPLSRPASLQNAAG